MSDARLSRRTVLQRASAGALGLASARAIGSAALAEEPAPAGQFLYVRRGDIWMWEAGETSRLRRDGALSDPRWSPSGRQILFVRTGHSYSDLVIYDFDSGEEWALTQNQSWAEEGSPDFVATSFWALDPDWAASGRIAFASDRTADGSMALWLIDDWSTGPYLASGGQAENGIEGVSLSADGSIAAYTARSREADGSLRAYVGVRNLRDGSITVSVDTAGGVFDPAISPDGQKIAIVIRAEDGVSDVWLVDGATGDRSRVTAGLQATKPAWSSDGQWLAYCRMVDYRFEIWATPVDLPSFGEPRRLIRQRDLDGASRISWSVR